MPQLTVRKMDEELIRLLKQRAARHRRSAEAEHREILRQALLEEKSGSASFAERAAELRARLKSGIDSAELIRADRDRDG